LLPSKVNPRTRLPISSQEILNIAELILYLDKINLATSPWAQKFVAHAILAPNYHLFAQVKIKMENIFCIIQFIAL